MVGVNLAAQAKVKKQRVYEIAQSRPWAGPPASRLLKVKQSNGRFSLVPYALQTLPNIGHKNLDSSITGHNSSLVKMSRTWFWILNSPNIETVDDHSDEDNSQDGESLR